MLVHQRRARLARLPHVVDGGKLLEIERHGRRNVLGLGTRRRHAHRDEFADLAHLAGGKHRLLGNLESRQPRHCADRIDAGEIRRGEDAAAITLRHMDAADQRMRQRAAHEGDVLQPGEADVGHELAAAAHQADRLPCAAAARRRLVRRPAPPAEGNSRSLRTVTFSPIELTLTSLRRDRLRQNWRDGVVSRAGAQTERRLQQTLGDDFVVLVVAQDESAAFVLRAPRRRPPCPASSAPISSARPSISAGLDVTIGTTCSSVRPSAIIELIACTRLNLAWPANGWFSSSSCWSGVPAGAGTWVL